MESEKRLTFTSINGQRHTQFISYREAMIKLRADTGEPLIEIATALKVRNVHRMGMAYLYGKEMVIRELASSEALKALLDTTIDTNELRDAWFEPDSAHASPITFGWFRTKFVEALKNQGLPCPASLLEPEIYTPGRENETLASANRRNEQPGTQVADAIRKLEIAHREIERLTALVPPVTGYLYPAVVAVQREFWLDWNESRPRPKANIILQWIFEHYPDLTTAQAQAIDKVACPINRDPKAHNQP
jgi:hypothetical protein